MNLVDSEARAIDDSLYITFESDASIIKLNELFNDSSALSTITMLDDEDETFKMTFENYIDFQNLMANIVNNRIQYEVVLKYVAPTTRILNLLADSAIIEDKPTDEDGNELPYKEGCKWIQVCSFTEKGFIIKWQQVKDES